MKKRNDRQFRWNNPVVWSSNKSVGIVLHGQTTWAIIGKQIAYVDEQEEHEKLLQRATSYPMLRH